MEIEYKHGIEGKRENTAIPKILMLVKLIIVGYRIAHFSIAFLNDINKRNFRLSFIFDEFRHQRRASAASFASGGIWQANTTHLQLC